MLVPAVESSARLRAVVEQARGELRVRAVLARRVGDGVIREIDCPIIESDF